MVASGHDSSRSSGPPAGQRPPRPRPGEHRRTTAAGGRQARAPGRSARCPHVGAAHAPRRPRRGPGGRRGLGGLATGRRPRAGRGQAGPGGTVHGALGTFAIPGGTPAAIGPGRTGTAPGPAEEEPGPDLVPPELEYLSATWAAAAARSRLALSTSGRTAAHLLVGSSPALLIPDRVAHAAVEFLCDADPAHLGMCPVEDGGCGWVFIDRSRNLSRRWCTMDDCGSHAKARRLTERRRAARSDNR